MKYLLEKDKKRRLIFQKYEKKKLILKVLSKDKRLDEFSRLLFRIKLSQYPKNASKTRVVNRCLSTGRAHGISRFFKMSRIEMRQYLLRGYLYGIKKASW